MAGKKMVSQQDAPLFGLCSIHPDGSTGWLLGGGDNGTEVKLYKDKSAAERALGQLKKDPHYSWAFSLEARAFTLPRRER